jgi:hypothetical protein
MRWNIRAVQNYWQDKMNVKKNLIPRLITRSGPFGDNALFYTSVCCKRKRDTAKCRALTQANKQPNQQSFQPTQQPTNQTQPASKLTKSIPIISFGFLAIGRSIIATGGGGGC